MKKWFCLLLCLMLACTGCGGAEGETTAAPTTEVTTVPVTEPPTTAAPTTLPTEPPLVLHSGLKEDGSFDAGTWFIGDSMTHILVTNYLKPNNLIGEANYTAKYGSQITAFFGDVKMEYNSYNKCAFNPEFENMEYDQVAQLLGEKATAIYIMWGTNFTWNAYADMYIELAEYLMETCPNATIHLQLIPWAGNNELVRYELVNEWIREAYAHFQEIGEERVMLIDTFEGIGKNTDEGYIHLNNTGNENWYNTIVAHAKEHDLPQ